MQKKSFEQTPESGSEKETAFKNYTNAMETYLRVTNKMRGLERRYPIGTRDSAINFEIMEMDKDRHQDHLKLIEIAKKLGKSKEDVLIDIIRWENSLADYGLPEFSILKSSDILDTQGFHSAIKFNIDEDLGRPLSPAPLNESAFGSDFGERVFPEDKILLVFSINPIEGYGEDEIKPEDYEEREKRAEALAMEINGEYFDNVQGGYHATSAHIIGVVFPIKDLESVLGIIRNSPDKFRLGKEFYG